MFTVEEVTIFPKTSVIQFQATRNIPEDKIFPVHIQDSLNSPHSCNFRTAIKEYGVQRGSMWP
jgi:hypothetical protein